MSDVLDKEVYERAIFLAENAHKGQKMRNGEPYFNHCKRVADLLCSYRLKTIAILHDVIEDTSVSCEDLLDEGFNIGIVDAVLCLSRRKGENYFDFIFRCCHNYDAVLVKLADLCDNMSDLKEGSLKDKYRFARNILNG